MREILLRCSHTIVQALYSENIDIEELEMIKNWCNQRIADIKAMQPQSVEAKKTK